jgi:hypothetical protein
MYFYYELSEILWYFVYCTVWLYIAQQSGLFYIDDGRPSRQYITCMWSCILVFHCIYVLQYTGISLIAPCSPVCWYFCTLMFSIKLLFYCTFLHQYTGISMHVRCHTYWHCIVRMCSSKLDLIALMCRAQIYRHCIARTSMCTSITDRHCIVCIVLMCSCILAFHCKYALQYTGTTLHVCLQMHYSTLTLHCSYVLQ